MYSAGQVSVYGQQLKLFLNPQNFESFFFWVKQFNQYVSSWIV